MIVLIAAIALIVLVVLVAIFTGRLGIFLPYPGTPLYEESIKMGFEPPKRTEDWGVIERYDINFNLPWVDKKRVGAIIRYNSFLNSMKMKSRLIYSIFNFMYKVRIKKDNFIC